MRVAFITFVLFSHLIHQIDAHLSLQLTRHRDHLLHLKPRWSNPLASAIRFDACVKEASEIANQVTGSFQPSSVPWINTTTDVDDLFPSPLNHVFVNDGDDSSFDSIDSTDDSMPADARVDNLDIHLIVVGDASYDHPLDLGDVLLSDMLLEENCVEESHDMQDTSTLTPADGWTLFPYTAAVSISIYSKGITGLIVQYTPRLQKILTDEGLIFDLNSLTFPSSLVPQYSDRVIGPFLFDEADIRRLDNPTALLNDICINGLAYYLQAMLNADAKYHLHSHDCAIFSTHDLVRIRYKASDQDLWRSVSKTEFWRKLTWIIPIHRPRESHWVLAVIHLVDGRIQVYDSLASKRGWPQDLKVVCSPQLISC